MTIIANIDNNTLQGINISHLGKRKIIFKIPFRGDMLVPWRVSRCHLLPVWIHHSPKNQARSCGRCLGTPSCCGGVGVAQPVACRELAEEIHNFLIFSFVVAVVFSFGHVLLQLLLFQKYFINHLVFFADWQMNESQLFL